MIADIQRDIRQKIRGTLRYGEPMSNHTSFRLGGPADIWIEPEDLADVRTCIRLADAGRLPLLVIGGGTNLLVKDEGVRGMVLGMGSPAMKHIVLNKQKVRATSSVLLKELLDFCADRGLGGAEFLSGIPGTVGGALMSNAGVRHYESKDTWLSIGDLVESVEVVDYFGRVRRMAGTELTFGYRTLALSGCIIIGAELTLRLSSPDAVIRKCRKFLEKKRSTQDLTAPSAGCVFKNPPRCDKTAAELIDAAGLRGLRAGAAAVSAKHANFIVNTGGARSRDVLELIESVKKKVKEITGIELTPEIKIV